MAKHRIQLKDLAERLGVNVATVSKALKDYPDISEKTKQKVRALANELNYLPDTQAGALRGKKSFIIGLIVPEIVHYFFSNVIKGIMDHVEEQGYRLLITLSNNSIASTQCTNRTVQTTNDTPKQATVATTQSSRGHQTGRA